MAYFELNGNFARSARRRAKAGRPSFRGLLKRLIETPFDQRSAEIADQLFLSSRTVESHRGALQRKLGVRSRAELARVARDVGLTA